MAKGSRYSGGLGGSSRKPVKIESLRDLVSEREGRQVEVDDVLTVSKYIEDRYGSEAIVEQFQVAKLKGNDAFQTLAYWDGQNIAINDNFFDAKAIQKSYDRNVKTKYHPPRGSKSAMEAVAAHEYGHALTGLAQKKLQEPDFDKASKRIVQEAKTKTSYTNVNKLALSISGYANQNYAECIAEAFADVYCNGNRAKGASKAIIITLNKYLP